MSTNKKYGWHLVSRSPWPFWALFGASMFALGMIFWMHKFNGLYELLYAFFHSSADPSVWGGAIWPPAEIVNFNVSKDMSCASEGCSSVHFDIKLYEVILCEIHSALSPYSNLRLMSTNNDIFLRGLTTFSRNEICCWSILDGVDRNIPYKYQAVILFDGQYIIYTPAGDTNMKGGRLATGPRGFKYYAPKDTRYYSKLLDKHRLSNAFLPIVMMLCHYLFNTPSETMVGAVLILYSTFNDCVGPELAYCLNREFFARSLGGVGIDSATVDFAMRYFSLEITVIPRSPAAG